MSLAKRFLPHSIHLNTKAGVSAWLDAVKSYAWDLGVEIIMESGGSETDTEFVAIRSVNPKMPITTLDLSFLGTCGFAGVPIAAGSGAPGLIAYGREQLSGALPTSLATTDHLLMTVTDGLLVPMSIHGSHNQAAEFALMLYAILGSDATYSGTVPMSFATGQAIASGGGPLANMYTASVVKFDSVLVQGNIDLSTDFGIKVSVEGDSGDVYGSMISITARNPKLGFTTKNSELIAAIGKGYSVTTFAQYYQKMAQNGDRVAKTSSAHISIAGTAGLIVPAQLTLAHQQAGVTPYTYTPSKNTNTIVVSTTSTIPTT